MLDQKPAQFKDLPEWVQDNLLSDETIEANKKIISEFGLSDEQTSVVFDCLRKIVLKQINLDDLSKFLQKFKFDKDKTNKLIISIITLRLVSLKDYLKIDLSSYIEKHGASISKQDETKFKSKEHIELEKKVDDIVSSLNIKFSSYSLLKRFKGVIVSFLKKEKTEIETRIILKRDLKIGGMGLDDKIVDNIINALIKSKQEPIKPADTGPVVHTQEKKASVVPPPVPSVSKPASLKPSFTKPPAPAVQDKKPPIPVPPAPRPVFQKKYKIETKQPLQSKIEKSEQDIKSIKKPSPIEEIKVKPKIYGPIDELHTITLVDWRRLGTPDKAISRMREKINLLAEESLLKKSQGIKAWKESEINKLYLQIGEESINQGKSVSEIIQQFKEQNKPTLSEEEFDAVVKFNEELRF